MANLTIYLPEDQKKKLDQLVKTRQISVSKFFQELLEEALRKTGYSPVDEFFALVEEMQIDYKDSKEALDDYHDHFLRH